MLRQRFTDLLAHHDVKLAREYSEAVLNLMHELREILPEAFSRKHNKSAFKKASLGVDGRVSFAECLRTCPGWKLLPEVEAKRLRENLPLCVEMMRAEGRITDAFFDLHGWPADVITGLPTLDDARDKDKLCEARGRTMIVNAPAANARRVAEKEVVAAMQATREAKKIAAAELAQDLAGDKIAAAWERGLRKEELAVEQARKEADREWQEAATDKAMKLSQHRKNKAQPCRGYCGMTWAGWEAAKMPDETAKWGPDATEEGIASRRGLLRDYKWVSCEGECSSGWWCPSCAGCCVRHEMHCPSKRKVDAAKEVRKAEKRKADGIPEPKAKKKKLAFV
jgi:hypothetical protein